MIVILFLNLLVTIVGIVFSWLPRIDTLPNMFGFDIDNALIIGMGYLNTFFKTFWPLQIMFEGFLVLLGYFLIKMTIRFFAGHRTPQ